MAIWCLIYEMNSLLSLAVSITLYVPKLPCPLPLLPLLRYFTSCPPTPNSCFSLPVFILGSAFSHLSLLLEQLFYWRVSDYPSLLLHIASKTPPVPQSLWAITPTHPCGCLLLLLLYSSTLRLFFRVGFTYYKTYCAVTMYISGRVLFSLWLNWNYLDF